MDFSIMLHGSNSCCFFYLFFFRFPCSPVYIYVQKWRLDFSHHHKHFHTGSCSTVINKLVPDVSLGQLPQSLCLRHITVSSELCSLKLWSTKTMYHHIPLGLYSHESLKNVYHLVQSNKFRFDFLNLNDYLKNLVKNYTVAFCVQTVFVLLKVEQITGPE